MYNFIILEIQILSYSYNISRKFVFTIKNKLLKFLKAILTVTYNYNSVNTKIEA